MNSSNFQIKTVRHASWKALHSSIIFPVSYMFLLFILELTYIIADILAFFRFMWECRLLYVVITHKRPYFFLELTYFFFQKYGNVSLLLLSIKLQGA